MPSSRSRITRPRSSITTVRLPMQKDFADAYSNRGGLYLMQGGAEKAIADFSEAIRLRDSDPTFWANRANGYLTLGRYKEAISDFDQALKIDPGNASVYLGRGRARIYSGAIPAAVEDLQTAVRLRPSNPNSAIWLHIARVHQRYADREELEANTAKVKRDPVAGRGPRSLSWKYGHRSGTSACPKKATHTRRPGAFARRISTSGSSSRTTAKRRMAAKSCKLPSLCR